MRSSLKFAHILHPLIRSIQGLLFAGAWSVATNASQAYAAEAAEDTADDTTHSTSEGSKAGLAEKDKRLPMSPAWLETRKSTALATALMDGSEIHWLEDNNEQLFLALHLEQSSGDAQGTVIILHGNNRHPDWPGIIHQLRTELPAWGWSTTSIAVAPYSYDRDEGIDKSEKKPQVSNAIEQRTRAPTNPLPKTEAVSGRPPSTHQSLARNSGNSDKEGSSETIPAVPETSTPESPSNRATSTLSHRLRQTFKLIESKAINPIIVIAQDLSAAWLIGALQSDLLHEPIAGIIFIGGTNPIGFDTHKSEDITIDMKKPFLDITGQRDTSFRFAQHRKIAATRAGAEHHQLTIIPAANPEFRNQENLVLNRIRGWLRKHFETPALAR